MPTVRTEVAELQYEVDGPADGTPVVLVHGFPDDPSTWDGVIELLPPGLRIVRPYLRGCAASRVTAPDEVAGGAQVAALARDLLDLTGRLGMPRFLLVGHDWGARTAHAAAVLAPEAVTGLVTLSTAYGPMTHLVPSERFAEAKAAWYRYWMCTERGARAFADDVEGFVRIAWRDWSPGLNLSDEAAGHLVASFANDQYAPLALHYYRHGAGEAPGRPRYAEDQQRLDEWPAIGVATTFLYGLDDGCEIPEASRGNQAFFGAGYDRVELPGVGHFIQRERPDAVAAAITRLLAGAAH